jgi:hypothetical protein
MAKARVAPLVEAQMEKVQKLNQRMSSLAFTMSAVSGIVSMFGSQFSEIAGPISMLTGGLFALMQVTSLLTASTSARLFMEKAQLAGGFVPMFNSFKGVSKGLAGFGKGLKGVFGVISKIAPIASRLIPILGALGLGFLAVTAIMDHMKKQEQKIEGLGNAASFSSEQLTKLGERLNVDIKTIDYTAGSAIGQGAQTEQEKDLVAEFLLDPEFKVEYQAAISGIQNSTKEQAELALSALATQLVNSGFEEETANAIIAGIVKSAGRTDLKLRFKAIEIDSAENATAAVDAAQRAMSRLNTMEVVGGIRGVNNEEIRKDRKSVV